MNRREFLKYTVLGLGAMATGCSSAPAVTSPGQTESGSTQATPIDTAFPISREAQAHFDIYDRVATTYEQHARSNWGYENEGKVTARIALENELPLSAVSQYEPAEPVLGTTMITHDENSVRHAEVVVLPATIGIAPLNKPVVGEDFSSQYATLLSIHALNSLSNTVLHRETLDNPGYFLTRTEGLNFVLDCLDPSGKITSVDAREITTVYATLMAFGTDAYYKSSLGNISPGLEKMRAFASMLMSINPMSNVEILNNMGKSMISGNPLGFLATLTGRNESYIKTHDVITLMLMLKQAAVTNENELRDLVNKYVFVINHRFSPSVNPEQLSVDEAIYFDIMSGLSNNQLMPLFE